MASLEYLSVLQSAFLDEGGGVYPGNYYVICMSTSLRCHVIHLLYVVYSVVSNAATAAFFSRGLLK